MYVAVVQSEADDSPNIKKLMTSHKRKLNDLSDDDTDTEQSPIKKQNISHSEHFIPMQSDNVPEIVESPLKDTVLRDNGFEETTNGGFET